MPGPRPPQRQIRYGENRIQVIDVHLPARPQGRLAVLIHGGLWSAAYTRSIQFALVADLVKRGWAVADLDYRGVGGGGGWPSTFLDVAAGLDALLPLLEDGFDADKVSLIGHSAGGHLALWAACRHRLPTQAPGHPTAPHFRAAALVAQAPVTDLAQAHRDRLGGTAVAELLGVPASQSIPAELLAMTSPRELLPIGVPTMVTSGARDDLVPVEPLRQFVEEARAAGDRIDLHVDPHADHFTHLDARSRLWHHVIDWLPA